jgi:hypothetical protein
MARNQEKPYTTPYHSLVYISTSHWVGQGVWLKEQSEGKGKL